MLTKVMEGLLSQKLKDEKRKCPCTWATPELHHVYCTWDAEGQQVPLLPWITACCSTWPDQKDAHRTVKNAPITLFPGKQPGKKISCNEHQTSWGESVSSLNTVSPVPWRPAAHFYWGCNCELKSTIPPAPGFTVLEINLRIFASFSLTSQSKRPLRGSRKYFLRKTPSTGNPWSEFLQNPKKALAQEHRHVSIYSELWAIMLWFC